jgi:hypothetical protein
MLAVRISSTAQLNTVMHHCPCLSKKGGQPDEQYPERFIETGID